MPGARVITVAVPWARHGTADTRFFDGIVAWLAAACSETTITALMFGPGRASPYWSVWVTHVIRLIDLCISKFVMNYERCRK
jgi:hypothetical protein